MTNNTQVRRHMGDSMACGFYGYEVKDSIHALKDRIVAKALWIKIGAPSIET